MEASITIGVVLAVLTAPSGSALPRARPALLRIRLVLTTESRAAELTLDTGTILNASVRSDDRALRVGVKDNHLSFSRDGGSEGEAHVRLLVRGIRGDARVRWHLTLAQPDWILVTSWSELTAKRQCR